MTISKLNIQGENNLTDTISDNKNNIIDNVASFDEHISRREISYSFNIDPGDSCNKMNCELSNAVSVKIYKQK